MAAGRSLDQVLEMTLYETQILFSYWNEMPPANEILAAVYSVEPSGGPKELTVEDIQNMPVPKDHLSIDELREQFRNGGLKIVSNND